jgi:nucleosome binding factor SPN SPT16 subunit
LTDFAFSRSSVDIPFSEGPVNLNWQAIMKTVNDDPYDFFKEGGWSFLSEKEDVRFSFPFLPRRRSRN